MRVRVVMKGGNKRQRLQDIFEFEEQQNGPDFSDRRRFTGTEDYRYSLGDDFEDEEIDSDEAFNEKGGCYG